MAAQPLSDNRPDRCCDARHGAAAPFLILYRRYDVRRCRRPLSTRLHIKGRPPQGGKQVISVIGRQQTTPQRPSAATLSTSMARAAASCTSTPSLSPQPSSPPAGAELHATAPLPSRAQGAAGARLQGTELQHHFHKVSFIKLALTFFISLFPVSRLSYNRQNQNLTITANRTIRLRAKSDFQIYCLKKQ